MTFYTLTFKKKIILSFLLILTIIIIIDIGLYLVVKMKSTKTTFIDEKFSKISHFRLNNSKNKDIIFIGSSRTFYHISTNTFKKNNINIYNFGLSGAQYEDYPTLISSINDAKPKHIIISLSVNRLFDKLKIPKLPTLEEITYYYNVDKVKFLQVLKKWIINRHIFLGYAEPIYYKIKSFYNKFESFKVTDKPQSVKIKNQKKSFIDSNINYSTLVNCKVFDIKQNDTTKIFLKCTNGDGVFIGNHLNRKLEKKELKIFNPQSIKYLNRLISNIDKRIEVTIILEPILHNSYTYNNIRIKNKFKGIRIIDLTNLQIKDGFWADHGHLNYKGREQYSQYLSRMLKIELNL